ncbi:MAG: hypothetical protein ACD_79C00053G0005 [uncultured bacterium]|nr:MAG: hypothetical protein ACD_79C00053G0005 [uncultured bacterium]
MISENEKSIISGIASKYNVKKILLFGSSLESDYNYKDIDLAVEGVPKGFFFSFYGELISKLSKPVDLIDLSKKNPFNDLISQEGVIIYG